MGVDTVASLSSLAALVNTQNREELVMPSPSAYDTEEAWMAACVPTMMDEGRDQDQAVAACLSMWRERGVGNDRLQKAYSVMHRAYSGLDVKSAQDEQRVIKGIATTPTVDRIGDVVEPMGAQYTVPMALILDHNHNEQVGHVEFAKPTKSGIPFEARIVKFDEPGAVKDLCDKAWHLVKTKLRSFVSIGFKALPDGIELMETGGLRFNKWEWLELSLVSIPANREAVILGAKSLDAAMREVSAIDQAQLAVAPLPLMVAKTDAIILAPVTVYATSEDEMMLHSRLRGARLVGKSLSAPLRTRDGLPLWELVYEPVD